MSALILLVITAACTAYQYFKGSLAKSVVNIFTILSAAVVAFAYFEILANLFITRAGSSTSGLLPWIQTLCFVLLFVIAFAILQTIASKLVRNSIEFDLFIERVGRCICGAFCGLLLTGVLLTAADMAPLPNNYPYQRFDSTPDPAQPNKAMLNPDGLVCGLFGLISRGSMNGGTSFAVAHPSFVDESFLNRHAADQNISLLTQKPAITVAPKAAAWLVSDNLKNQDQSLVTPKTGHALTVVRVSLDTQAAPFTFSQLRLICNEKVNSDAPTQGKGVNIYPLGYLNSSGRLQSKRLNEKVELSSSKGRKKTLDFVFDVPNDYFPALVAFKQNSLASVPRLISAADASEPESF